MGRKDVRIKMFIVVLFIMVKKEEKQLDWTSKICQSQAVGYYTKIKCCF